MREVPGLLKQASNVSELGLKSELRSRRRVGGVGCGTAQTVPVLEAGLERNRHLTESSCGFVHPLGAHSMLGPKASAHVAAR